MHAEISVIIPIYNVEEYLSKCLESVLSQTFTGFEAILVNDGSTDSSAYIMQSFAEGDERFKVIAQPNAGLSAARNTGLRHAVGEYIFYLDSDDWLTADCLELLFDNAQRYNADVTQGNFYYDYPLHLMLNKQQKKSVEVFTRESAMEELLRHKVILNFAWGKLIRTKIAKQVPFPTGKFFEDTLWMAKVIHFSGTFVCLDQPILHYRQRQNSISGDFSLRNADQIVLESERLHFIKKEYNLHCVKLAERLLSDKITRYDKMLKYLSDSDAQDFRKILNETKHTHHLSGLSMAQTVSNFVQKLVKRSIHRAFGNPHFRVIPKENSEGLW